jgi:hypothetical protein
MAKDLILTPQQPPPQQSGLAALWDRISNTQIPLGSAEYGLGVDVNDILKPLTDNRGSDRMLPESFSLNDVGKLLSLLPHMADVKGMAEGQVQAQNTPADPNEPYGQFKRLLALFPMIGAEGGGAVAPATERGFTTLGTYAGRKSATADHAALAKAERMEKAGESAAPDGRIRQHTGWFKEPGGDWQYEISDLNTAVTPHPTDANQYTMDHPKLFEAYPELKDMPVHQLRQDADVKGWYGRGGMSPDDGEIGLRGGMTPAELRSTGLHEFNHAVQDIEGFPVGAMPYKADAREVAWLTKRRQELDKKEAFDGLTDAERREAETVGHQLEGIALAERNALHDYRRTLGEVSSRDVQARADYPDWKREAVPPYTSEKIPDLIIRRDRPKGERSASADLPAGRSWKTEDGYTFHEAPDGRIVDDLNPDLEDLSFSSFDDMVQRLGYQPSLVGSVPDEMAARRSQDLLKRFDEFGQPGPEDIERQKANKALDVQGRRKNMAAVPDAPPDPATSAAIASVIGQDTTDATARALPVRRDLFDYTRLSDVPQVAQIDLQRNVPARGPSARVQALDDKKTIKRINETVSRGAKDGIPWYNTEPLRQSFIDEFGMEEGGRRFSLYMDMVAGTSPRSDVGTNARNASYYYQQALQGNQPGKPLPKPYGHLAQDLHIQNFNNIMEHGGMGPETTFPVLQNPKPPSFSQNLQGNQQPITADTHLVRNWGVSSKLPDWLLPSFKPDKDAPTVRPRDQVTSGAVKMKNAPPVWWDSMPKANEYPMLELLSQREARKMGMTPAQWQASAWVGGGGETGLASGADPFLRHFENRVILTAQKLGITPMEALRQFQHGKITLLSPPIVPHGAVGQDEPQDKDVPDPPPKNDRAKKPPVSLESLIGVL